VIEIIVVALWCAGLARPRLNEKSEFTSAGPFGIDK
jgi:hypothetical protein